ncbi:hypothetical protein AX15_007149 [Amanita polypyramis BW_CC]|nr:hypothetical protein AX15_007149 [Amanita polypyramis BW_CC]
MMSPSYFLANHFIVNISILARRGQVQVEFTYVSSLFPLFGTGKHIKSPFDSKFVPTDLARAMFRSIAYCFLFLQIFCAHFVASQSLISTTNTNFYITNRRHQAPGDIVQTARGGFAGPPQNGSVLTISQAGTHKVKLFNKRIRKYIGPNDYGRAVWSNDKFIWEIEPADNTNTTFRVIHPEVRLYWYSAPENPYIIQLVTQDEISADGDDKWFFGSVP